MLIGAGVLSRDECCRLFIGDAGFRLAFPLGASLSLRRFEKGLRRFERLLFGLLERVESDMGSREKLRLSNRKNTSIR